MLEVLLETVLNDDNVEIILFGDNLSKETKQMVQGYNGWRLPDRLIETKAHGNAETFLEVMEYALNNFENDDIIYFVEDDYLHKPGAMDILREGFKRAEYVSLYDHPDKYDGNAKILFHTKSSHWQFVQSTTMTFAVQKKR